MSKWEYAEVLVSIDAERGGSTAKAHSDLTVYRYDEKHEEKEGPLGKVMAYMGDNGWELVATTTVVGGAIIKQAKALYLFKRPKAE